MQRIRKRKNSEVAEMRRRRSACSKVVSRSSRGYALCIITALFTLCLGYVRQSGDELTASETLAESRVAEISSTGDLKWLADSKKQDILIFEQGQGKDSTKNVPSTDDPQVPLSEEEMTDILRCRQVLGESFEPDPDVIEHAERVVGIGDVHGDVDALIQALELAKVVSWDGSNPESVTWTGGTTVVVQTGDVLDGRRGAFEVHDTWSGRPDHALFDLIDRLAEQAKTAGGRFLRLLGNHETMNVMGYMSYASSQEWQEYASSPGGRSRAFAPGGSEAIRLGCTRKLSVRVGKNVFAHGGVHPFHLCDYYSRAWGNPLPARPAAAATTTSKKKTSFFRSVNGLVRTFLLGTSPDRVNAAAMSAFWLDSRRGVVWMRDFGGDDSQRWMSRMSRAEARQEDLRCEWDASDPCDALQKGLAMLESERLIVGHTPQILPSHSEDRRWTLNVSSDCRSHLWRIDTAMSTAFSGLHREAGEHVVTALVITNDETVNVLRAPYKPSGNIKRARVG